MLKLTDYVHVAEDGFVRLRNKAGAFIAGRPLLSVSDKPLVEVKGWVDIVMRERGKIVPGSRRSGHNIWTNTGREFLAMLMSLETVNTTYRQDRVAYIGCGIGTTQLEEPNVLSLLSPAEYAPGLFLAPLDLPTFPLTPTRTTVRYFRSFSESELTTTPNSTKMISELGLFTDGAPDAVPVYSPGTRHLEFDVAGQQSPVAYKTFEPVGKTDALVMEVAWEIRF
jgi:hypothetical protein